VDRRAVRQLTARLHTLVEADATELAVAPMEVPLTYYRDRTLWEWERGVLLHSTPIVAAPSAQVARPGDYHVRRLLDTSVLVTRDRTGRARVLLNYCSHRGARVADGSGSARSFVCPYHHWTYGGDGKLLGRPRAECFAGLPARDEGLVELPSEERHGLVWCLLEPDGELDLDTHLRPLAPELEAWRYGRCTYLDHREVAVAANWKAGLENFADFYHVPWVHTSFPDAHLGDVAAFDRFGRHHRLVSGLASLRELSREDAERVEDDSHLVVAYWVFPNLVLIHSRATLDLIQIQPGADPGSCTLRHTSLARRPALNASERADYEGIWKALGVVFTGEDVAVLERAGDGLARSAREQLRIGRNEPGVQNMIRTLRAAGRACGQAGEAPLSGGRQVDSGPLPAPCAPGAQEAPRR